MPTWTSGLPEARSSPRPPLPSKVMPTVRRIWTRVPTPGNSRANIRTGPSPAASGTLCYVRAWAEKYKNQGLVVIGVHSPEFAFEKNVDNVRRATKEMRVDYPIAIDTDFAIWRALKNEYWPALYIVDAQGRVRHHQFGEGEYERSEKIIQQLLAEAGTSGIGHDLVSVDARGAEAAADWGSLKSPEN